MSQPPHPSQIPGLGDAYNPIPSYPSQQNPSLSKPSAYVRPNHPSQATKPLPKITLRSTRPSVQLHDHRQAPQAIQVLYLRRRRQWHKLSLKYTAVVKIGRGVCSLRCALVHQVQLPIAMYRYFWTSVGSTTHLSPCVETWVAQKSSALAASAHNEHLMYLQLGVKLVV